MSALVFLIDVDNTLLDNDQVRLQLEAAVTGAVGAALAARFWEIYEEVREALDVVSFPETLERFSRACDDLGCLGDVTDVLYRFPFADCLYPGALGAIEHLRAIGRPVVLSDGDQLFQRHKIKVAGIEAAVDRHVLVYVHKEQERDDIRRRFPAEHYVIFDDKPRIHAAIKSAFGDEITTVLVKQGKYAQAVDRNGPPPDLVIDSIREVSTLHAEELASAARSSAGE